MEINPVRFLINRLGKQSEFDSCVPNKCFRKPKKCKGLKWCGLLVV